MKQLFGALLLLCSVCVRSQSEATVRAYIEKYKDVAVAEMLRAKIPASITLAQGIHESSCGRSELALNARNHFGIKCHKEWTGPGYTYDDDKVGECFRIYKNAEESYRDHSDFLCTRARYNSLFGLKLTDYKGWAHGLKAAGYATNPKYAHILIDLIEKYELHKFDHGLLSDSAANTEGMNRDADDKGGEKNAPRRPFDFHGIRTIVAAGDENPLAVATEFNVDYKLLLQYNDLQDGETFRSGEHIFLQPKRKHGSEKSCVVKEGDNMWVLSQRYGISLASLYSLNKMQPNDQPLAGEVLSLKEMRNVAPRSVNYEQHLADVSLLQKNTVVKEIYYYEVQPKETLYSLSKRFGVSQEELMQWNDLRSPDLKTGQTLIVGKKR